jgi:uracil-DNA glycosylase
VPGEHPDQFNWIHSIAVDSTGALYVAEVSFCNCGKHQKPNPREMASLRKWVIAPDDQQ